MEAVEWLAPFKRYTERLREHVEHRTLEETVAYAAQETNLSWDTVKEIDKARLRRLYEHFHWDNSRRLAVDEFAIHRGHRYATVVYSIDTKKVLWLDPENRGIYTQSDSSKKSSRNIWSLAVVSVDQRY